MNGISNSWNNQICGSQKMKASTLYSHRKNSTQVPLIHNDFFIQKPADYTWNVSRLYLLEPNNRLKNLRISNIMNEMI